MIARRDQAADRLRTGSLALNGSSIVAILASLSGEGSAAKWIGLSPDNTSVAAAFFVVGAGLAGLSLVISTGLFATESSDAFERMLATRRVAAAYETDDSPAARAEALTALTAMHATPLVDFQYSNASIVMQSLSAGAWLGGMIVPLSSAFGLGGKIAAAWAFTTSLFI